MLKRAVSYTHLDVYKRQLVNNMVVAAVSEAIRNAVRHAATVDGIPGLAG